MLSYHRTGRRIIEAGLPALSAVEGKSCPTYGKWRFSPADQVPGLQVFLRWRPGVHVEAGSSDPAHGHRLGPKACRAAYS